MRVGIAGYGVVGKKRYSSIIKNTSFKVKYHKNCKVTKPPTPKQLNILRNIVDPLNIRKLEFTSGEERIKLLQDIIKKEKELIKSLN